MAPRYTLENERLWNRWQKVVAGAYLPTVVPVVVNSRAVLSDYQLRKCCQPVVSWLVAHGVRVPMG